ncbi:MAG: hypothetical protein Tsb0021_16060 [Chlamydiales bacterium]
MEFASTMCRSIQRYVLTNRDYIPGFSNLINGKDLIQKIVSKVFNNSTSEPESLRERSFTRLTLLTFVPLVSNFVYYYFDFQKSKNPSVDQEENVNIVAINEQGNDGTTPSNLQQDFNITNNNERNTNEQITNNYPEQIEASNPIIPTGLNAEGGASETITVYFPIYIRKFEMLDFTTEEMDIQRASLQSNQYLFSDIQPPKNTIVKVNDKNFHANRVEMKLDNDILGQYIATQSPSGYNAGGHHRKEHVLYEEFFFWTMVINEKAPVIDLTQVSSAYEEIPPYYPQVIGRSRTFKESDSSNYLTNLKEEKVEVKLTSVEEKGDQNKFYIYEYDLAYYSKEGEKIKTHIAKRLHFPHWIDGEIPNIDELEDLLIECANLDNNNALRIVHCKAGVGRTGTFITAAAITKLFNQDKIVIDKSEAKDGKIWISDIYDVIDTLIIDGRKARGPGFVQKDCQFKSLYDLVQVLSINKFGSKIEFKELF